MKKIYGVVLGLVGGVAQVAAAGVGSSGGGKAVVCRDSGNQILSATLLDLYEAEVRDGLSLRQSTGDFAEEYLLTATEMQRVTGYPLTPPQAIKDHLERTMRNAFRILPSGETLQNIDDIGVRPALRAGCRLEQAAVFHLTEAPFFDVSGVIWDKMDVQSQAALVIHELLYRTYRMSAEEETSESVRKIVGRLFSTTPLPAYNDNLPTNWQMCHSSYEGFDPLATRFYAYPGPGGGTTLRFLNLMGRETYWPIEIQISAEIKRDVFAETLQQGSRILTVTDEAADFDGEVRIGSGPYEGYLVRVRYKFEQPFSVSLTDPTGRLTKLVPLTMCAHPAAG